jgi:hypothetical protein
MKFISEYSIVLIIPILIIAGISTWFFYVKDSKLKELPKMQRNLVYFSRFISLSIVITLLLGILFEFIKTKNENPILITVIDNSSSLKNYKDSNLVSNQIQRFVNNVDKEFDANYEKVTYLVGDKFVKARNFDLKDQKSFLSEAFEEIFKTYYNRNIGGIIFISDGNYNLGQNPIYSANKIPFTPVFSLGVGDTIAKKDQLIKDVICNDITFLKNKFPVEVNLEAFKIGKRSVTVSILKDGKTITSQQVNYSDGEYENKQILFELEAKSIGFQHYVAEVKGITDEYTLKNNRRSFYVEVIDSRSKILLLSAAPHPDLSAIKSVLEKDENSAVEIQNIDKWDRNLTKTDLIIWHEPGVNFNENINQIIQNSNIPVLYFVGMNTNSSVINKLNIGLNISNSNQFDEVQANLSEGFELFEISDELKNELTKFPPAIVKYAAQKLSPQSKIFLTQKVGNINKKDALMYFSIQNNKKFGVFLGEGIWKWKMNTYLKYKNHDLFNEFVQKVNQYLVLKENTSNLRITLPKRFSVSEEIIIKAEFYNQSMELITKPKIKFNLTDNKGKKSELEFGVNGNYYLLPLGKLKSGSYSWNASTEFSGKKYTKSGAFVVENINIEKLETRANHSLLRQISDNTKGKFYLLKNQDQLIKDIKMRDDITSTSYQESSFDSLLDYFYLLLVVLFFLTLEWFIKRWNGLY